MYSSSLSVSLLFAFLIWQASQATAHDDNEYDNEYAQLYDTMYSTAGTGYQERRCASRDQALIHAELAVATSMSNYAQANLGSTTAALCTFAFIPSDLISGTNIISQLSAEYGNGGTMKDGSDYKFTVTCDDTKPFCKRGTPVANLKGNKTLASTADIISQCTGATPTYNSLEDIWSGKEQSLLHEWTYTRYFMGGASKTIDYAYGVQNCFNFAAESYMMPEYRESRKVKGQVECICPSEEDQNRPGICDPNLSIDNAHTLSIIAGGLWFGDKAQCNRVLPIGLVAAGPPTPKYKDSVSVSKISTSSIPLTTITSAPASVTSASSSSLASITSALPCLMHEDPDAGTPPICQCSNGVNVSPVTSTNTAGQTGKYCPWTTLPTQAMTTTKPSAPPTTAAPYQFTYTDPYGVELCQSTLVTHLAGYTLTELNATTTGDDCKLLEWEEISWRKRDAFASNGPQEPTTGRGGAHFCNMNGFLDTQFYDGIQETAKTLCKTEFGFELGELGNLDCASTVDLVGEVLGNIFDNIFPEFIWLIEMGVKLGEIACDAAETFNPTRLLPRDPETSMAVEKLAKAWAKEVKKERILPIPEHKKRELGLLL
ncbi:hypothetical protein BGAL_0009g00090 [Botrytis galanthina]|uniref:Uncharacterized protein n=1 Tax=Botrytis galanthina TaxID=278940 RepID=A0A4S8RC67_9HELO|nr:hypothetical protein BGAL_0009g00090 [Botrytis galanthina]